MSTHTRKSVTHASWRMLLTEQKFERHCLHALTSWTPTHPDINVFSGCVIDDLAVNVHGAVEVGAADQQAFEGGWPASFHLKLTKKVKNMAAVMKVTAKHANVDTAIDTEFICSRSWHYGDFQGICFH